MAFLFVASAEAAAVDAATAVEAAAAADVAATEAPLPYSICRVPGFEPETILGAVIQYLTVSTFCYLSYG